MLKKTPFFLKDVLIRLKRRNFSGNTGQVIKNSGWTTATTLVSKIGSLIFTVLIARLLMPELFGLYSLALSTISLFTLFSDLGIGQTLIKFVVSSKSEKKSKAYFSYLLKIKIIMTSVLIFIIIFLSYFIANYYYEKPIFYALIAGSFYIAFNSLNSLFANLFPALNNFKKGLFQEIIFQVLRLIIVPLLILIFISRLSSDVLITSVILGLSFSYLIVFLYIFFSAQKEINFLKKRNELLKKDEKSIVNKFIFSLSALTLSGLLFGYIDIIILGRFVGAEFIAYYKAALSLITSAIPLLTFSSVLFPLFIKLKGKRLYEGFQKARNITILLGIFAFLFTLVFSPVLVKIIFGEEYILSASILRIFSILLLISPIISLYSSFYISQGKLRKVVFFLFFSIALNILLNIVAIFLLASLGSLAKVYGITISTIISNLFYLGMLVLWPHFRKH